MKTDHADKVEAYLSQYGDCKLRLDRLQLEYDDIGRIIREHLEPLYAWVRFKPDAEANVKSMMRKCRADQENVLRQIRKTEELMTEIRNTVEAMPEGTERDIIKARYIDGLKWEQISEQVVYAVSAVCKKHQDALQSIVKVPG